MDSNDNISRFIQAQEKARKLIQMDSNGMIDKYARNAKENGKINYNENIEYVSEEPTKMKQHIIEQNNSFNKTKSKLPKEILESIQNNPIKQVGDVSTPSILDQLNITPPKKEIVIEEKPIIKETQQFNNNNIDYSMIKIIVEDCMKKYTSALKKSIINENKLNENNNTLQAMKIGNKFSFITNDGNLYEAELKFIKNINNKKK